MIGILECIAVGWFFNLKKVHHEINRNAKKFKAPYWWLASSIKVVSPLLLAGLFVWNLFVLFHDNGGSYNPDYPMWAQVCGGWIVSGLVFISGFIAKIVINSKKKKEHFVEDDVLWDPPVVVEPSPVVDSARNAKSKKHKGKR